MEIIQLILAAIILVTIYKRMLKWGSAGDLSKKQKYAPIGLGILSVIISFLFVAGIALFSVNVLGFRLDEIENQSLRAAATGNSKTPHDNPVYKTVLSQKNIRIYSYRSRCWHWLHDSRGTVVRWELRRTLKIHHGRHAHGIRNHHGHEPRHWQIQYSKWPQL